MTFVVSFSLGPVQGFVAQSRRTRDLWGSSYLLSFLAGQAMHGAVQAGGTLTRPRVQDDPLYSWIGGTRTGQPPLIGSLPNQFEVECSKDPRDVALAAESALIKAWRQVCEAVRERYLPDVGSATRSIWERQIGSFWELTWVVANAGQVGLLARRKHWRTHRLSDEPGDKCTIMHDLQELSGQVRARSRAEQDRFWASVRARTSRLDVREDERLCSIALVKRLFVRVAEKALGWSVDASSWPSTVTVAAVPWLRQVIAGDPDGARDYAARARESAPDEAGSNPLLLPGLTGPLARLDANYLHAAFVADERLCPLQEAASREALMAHLKELHEAHGEPPLFYALLLADGDRLGDLVGALGAEVVGQALSRFTKTAPELIRSHDGVTVYAGGDDVLAMLPARTALRCAAALSGHYRACFESCDATLSAAVAFAQARVMLGAVLTEAHRLLDEVAKEQNQRNSLAVGILNPGGLHCQWVSCWNRPEGDAVDLLERLAENLRSGGGALSSGMLYRVRHLLSLLCGWPRWQPGGWGKVPAGLDVSELLLAEILANREGGEAEARSVAGLLAGLLARCGPREPGRPEVGLDGPVLARFLAAKESI